MTDPIEYLAKRYRCPHCRKSLSSRSRMRTHMGICWLNPERRGCKTCKHFEPPSYEAPDECKVGVDLRGGCPECGTNGEVPWGPGTAICKTCNGWPPKAGPITNCAKWEAA